MLQRDASAHACGLGAHYAGWNYPSLTVSLIVNTRLPLSVDSDHERGATAAVLTARFLFAFAADICNAPSPMFTGPQAMMQNLPFMQLVCRHSAANAQLR